MYTILLTGIGGITPQNIARSLKASNSRYKIIGTDVELLTLGVFHECVDRAYLVPRSSEEGYIEEINSIIRKENVDLLICSPDSELKFLNKNRRLINCNVFLPPEEVIEIVLNKAST